MPAYTVPIVVENTGHLERSYEIYSRLLKDRIILLGTEIDDTVASLICAQLLSLKVRIPRRKSIFISILPEDLLRPV